MKITQTGLQLIKEFEGCHLKAYQDVVGVWTIGYGVTNADKSITGKTITKGMTISQATADTWLRECLEKKYLPLVMKYDYKYHWNENEANALLSFCYNIGSIKQLTADGTRTRAEIASAILKYNKAGGKVYAGLTRRRKAEQKLFLAPVTKKHYSGTYPKLPERGYFKYGDGVFAGMSLKPQIKLLQALLNWVFQDEIASGKLSALKIDGEYGPLTDKRVERLQRDHDLVVNGCYGKKCEAVVKGLTR